MTDCFWAKPPVLCTDDCVQPVAMLNLKTANLVNLAWSDPPATDPSVADTVSDLGKVYVPLGSRSAASGYPALTFQVPLRSIGGAFSIGANNYARPPTLTNQVLYIYVTVSTVNLGWPPGDVTTYSTGYVNCSADIIDGGGTVVQSFTWCYVQAEGLAADGITRAYGNYPAGAFPTGQGSGPLGSYIVYGPLRFLIPISTSFPAADFDNGLLRVSWLMSDTSSTGGAGAPSGGFTLSTTVPAVVKLVAADNSFPPPDSTLWDY